MHVEAFAKIRIEMKYFFIAYIRIYVSSIFL